MTEGGAWCAAAGCRKTFSMVDAHWALSALVIVVNGHLAFGGDSLKPLECNAAQSRVRSSGAISHRRKIKSIMISARDPRRRGATVCLWMLIACLCCDLQLGLFNALTRDLDDEGKCLMKMDTDVPDVSGARPFSGRSIVNAAGRFTPSVRWKMDVRYRISAGRA